MRNEYRYPTERQREWLKANGYCEWTSYYKAAWLMSGNKNKRHVLDRNPDMAADQPGRPIDFYVNDMIYLESDGVWQGYCPDGDWYSPDCETVVG